jgi:hypothetical protein
MPIIYDLKHESGVAEICIGYDAAIRADEMIENGKGRYVRKLPPGTKLGPRSGIDGRIVL